MRGSRAAAVYLSGQRVSAQLARSRQRRALAVSVQAPIGGWNTRDSLDDMKPEDAVQLDNWFPGLGSCAIRGGTSSYATGLGAAVKTLAEFNAGSSHRRREQSLVGYQHDGRRCFAVIGTHERHLAVRAVR
jgi:hypothetical protein